MFTQGGNQATQCCLATQLRVDAGGVDHIVAMHGAGAGAQERRGIQVADAQSGKIRHQRHRIIEGKAFMKLQALGGAQGQCVHRSRS